MDVLLSSGFLAFARHIGFRRVIVENQDHITGICGTSSGSVVGAMWAAGIDEAKMIELLNETRPIKQVNFHWKIWSGLFTFTNFKSKLRSVLPERIEDLPIPFGVGLCTMDRQAIVVTKGNLVDALAASCAVPYMFHPMPFEGDIYRDGGFADRIGAQPWRNYREKTGSDVPMVAHIVDRSKGVADEQGLDGVKVVRTPRSFATLFSIGDFFGHIEEAAELTRQQYVE